MSQFVLKVHSRCDLACDHCYVYEHADQSWRARPHAMAPDTVRAAAARIAEHAAAHRLPEVHVILHGGEPLLLGVDRLRATLAELRAAIAPVTGLDLRLQTNGVRLTEPACDLFAEFDVKVGVSLDGDLAANDRHRRFASGASSHRQVLDALALLRRPGYRRIYAGILCTIDLRNDPVEVYEALIEQEPPAIELLFPHATWDQPPLRPDGVATPYAAWLGRIYQRWVAGGRPVPIRLFDSLRSLGAGGPSGTEALGLDPADLVVIETDGAWEQADSLKTAYDGAPATGLTVFEHSADEVAAQPAIAGRQAGLAGLCPTCRACAVVDRCGGGLYAHRYRTGSGFDNPSVYCPDLMELMNVTPPPEFPPDVLDQIGSGYGDAATLDYLAEAQLALNRALLVAVAAGAAPGSLAAAGWRLLGELDEAAPEATRAVLAHPFLRRWAVSCLNGAPEHDYLASVAAAAAVRAGVTAELMIPVRNGAVQLPGIARLELGKNENAFIRIANSTFSVRDGDGWQPVWRVDEPSLVLDDIDPDRDCYDIPVASRLAAVDDWARLLQLAWLGIGRDVPAHRPAMRIGLRCVVPLRPDPGGRLRSATSKDAFGAVGIAFAADADTLAGLLVHEFQHVKLGAVVDLVDLVDPGDARRLPVPWRADPRPLEAVLQGIYAHLGLAELWRARGGDEPFHTYRDWTAGAIDALLRTGALTADGERLVWRMRDTVHAWR